jgi:type IV pilus assembly protein PilC
MATEKENSAGKKSAAKTKTFVFEWKASNAKGDIISGETDAVSINAVKTLLRSRGLVNIISVTKEKQGLFGGEKKIKDGDMVALIRQLSALISAGVPLIDSVVMLSTATKNPGVKKLLKKIGKSLNDGKSFSEALEPYPNYFDHLFISMIRAGEQAGILDSIFKKLADFKEKSSNMKKKIKSALFYPAAIIVVMAVVVSIIMIFVIPKIAGLFTSFGATLPALTLLVIGISDFMQANWWWLMGIPVALVYLHIYAHKRSEKYRFISDRIFLKLPVVGKSIILAGSVSRFMATLASMQGAGVPLNEALSNLKYVSGNALIGKSIEAAQKAVTRGESMSRALGESKVFPYMAISMLSIGEQTGEIEVMASKVADFYEEEVNETVSRMNTLMEPVIMVVLGVVVGVLIVAMYLPILKMGAVVTHGG